MIFDTTGKYFKDEFKINNKTLQPVNSFCYLGFEVKPSGTVKHAMNILHDKARNALRPLLCAIARFNISVKTSIRLFHAYISPILLYNVENWATMTDKVLNNFKETELFDRVDDSSIDIIHRKILKYTLGLSKSCPNMAAHGDTGELPLSIKGYRLMLEYWKRLITLPDTSLAKKALKENVEIRTNWIITIEKLLKLFDLIETTNNEKKFKSTLKTNTITYYKTHWENKVKEQGISRLEFYKKVHTVFKPAKYIDLSNFKKRKTIARIRCSNHCLEIEKGRHRNIDRANRTCKICTDKVVEDEEHFLLKCKTYENLRNKYQIPTDNAADIMNCETQENLAHFLISAFTMRNELLDPSKESE